jgi:hypothetical protein
MSLVKQTNFDVALAEELAELGGGGFGNLMKFDANTLKFNIVGGDEVELGREYIAHPDQYARGWTKFVEKKPVDRKVFKIGDGEPPERDELDEPERAGRSDDPWCYQRYLPLEDIESGEIVTFVGKSVGSKIGLLNLLKTFCINQHRGLPIIKLATGTFSTTAYGRKPHPAFAVIGWTGDGDASGGGGPIDVTPGKYDADLAHLHGDEGDPPENDPEDPGYDLSTFSRR